jgi:uncharacterized coiled-coil protein SlyX
MQKRFTVLMDTNLDFTPYVNAGPTCQLCDNTGHAARSCPTHLNEVSASLARVSGMENTIAAQKRRLAELDAQVKRMQAIVTSALVDIKELKQQVADEDGLTEEFWEEHKAKAEPVAYGRTRTTGCSYAEMY